MPAGRARGRWEDRDEERHGEKRTTRREIKVLEREGARRSNIDVTMDPVMIRARGSQMSPCCQIAVTMSRAALVCLDGELSDSRWASRLLLWRMEAVDNYRKRHSETIHCFTVV